MQYTSIIKQLQIEKFTTQLKMLEELRRFEQWPFVAREISFCQFLDSCFSLNPYDITKLTTTDMYTNNRKCSLCKAKLRLFYIINSKQNYTQRLTYKTYKTSICCCSGLFKNRYLTHHVPIEFFRKQLIVVCWTWLFIHNGNNGTSQTSLLVDSK